MGRFLLIWREQFVPAAAFSGVLLVIVSAFVVPLGILVGASTLFGAWGALVIAPLAILYGVLAASFVAAVIDYVG